MSSSPARRAEQGTLKQSPDKILESGDGTEQIKLSKQQQPYERQAHSPGIDVSKPVRGIIVYSRTVSPAVLHASDGQLNARYRYIRVSIVEHIDISIYRRHCPIFSYGSGLISIHNTDVSSQDYRYFDTSISYRPSLLHAIFRPPRDQCDDPSEYRAK